MMRECVLESGKSCTECGACQICDLDKTKICDNCCRCLGDADYRGVKVTEIVIPTEMKFKWKRKKEK